MHINVAGLLKETPGAVRDVSIEASVEDVAQLGLPLVGVVRGAVRLVRTNRGIFVDARLQAKVAQVCRRCLRTFPLDCGVQIKEEAFPLVDVQTGLALRAPDSDAFQIDQHHVLDLGEPFRQYLLVNLPMAPLCSEACKGLCGVCGRDLNEGSCGCEQRGVDVRLESLSSLLDSSPDED